MSRSSSGGFTLIELMISVALIAVIAAIAVPSYRDFNQKTQLTGAAEEVFSHIQYARSESIANGEDIFVAFKGTGATGWCVGISDGAACDCAASLAACTINGVQARSLQGNDYPQTVLTTDFAADDSGFSAPGLYLWRAATLPSVSPATVAQRSS